MPRHKSRQQKKSLRKDRKKLRSIRKSLRNSRKNTRRGERPKRRSSRTIKLRIKKKQSGGNKSIMTSATFKPASNPVYPPGGMYNPGSSKNGLGGGYYYGLSKNGTTSGMTQSPESTTGDPTSYNNNGNDLTQRGNIQSGGDPVSSLGGFRTMFRNLNYRFNNLVAKFSGEEPPTNPNPMVQPVNNNRLFLNNNNQN